MFWLKTAKSGGLRATAAIASIAAAAGIPSGPAAVAAFTRR
ncbi:hypothetical protein [Lentzea albidocapillata]|uniref:Muconate cycloisomerase n=1 Tax=Lentzea albidocapillata TaxID=40571 RepID=A0A1W2CZZ8_9PSEU|nr:hypothetical protein [Lentzea albidocapillata]SMC90847.1 muconate cycloisomerase [Lentzea albidocapillata]